MKNFNKSFLNKVKKSYHFSEDRFLNKILRAMVYTCIKDIGFAIEVDVDRAGKIMLHIHDGEDGVLVYEFLPNIISDGINFAGTEEKIDRFIDMAKKIIISAEKAKKELKE